MHINIALVKLGLIKHIALLSNICDQGKQDFVLKGKTRWSELAYATTKGKEEATGAKRHFEDEKEETLACSGKTCNSCAGVFLADCIAVSCCPCAIIDLLALVCFKVPFVTGKKCVQYLINKKKVTIKKSDVSNREEAGACVKRNALYLENECRDVTHSGLEKEPVWFSLDQIGHWGFGRVSFSGDVRN